MKAKIDLEKFISSMLGYAEDNFEETMLDYLHSALQDQGLEYEDGEIVEIEQESEDERIRKEILEFVTIVADSKSNKMEWIAWLEKQGEKPKWSEEDEAHLHSITTHLGQWIERHPNTCGADIQWENLAWLKQIKQKLGGEQ